METVELPIGQLVEAPWNANQMDLTMMAHLRESVERFGLVAPLVVRLLPNSTYEVLSGNQRLHILRDLGYESAPCVVVKLDGAHARLLAQALNHIRGEDDVGTRAELLRSIMGHVSQEEVLRLLPETAESLQALASLGQADLAEHLRVWESARHTRLRHFIAQLTDAQWRLVMKALAPFLTASSAQKEGNPNRRGVALYSLCLAYLASKGEAA